MLKLKQKIFYMSAILKNNWWGYLFTTNGRRFLHDYYEFNKQADKSKHPMQFGDFLPCLKDYSEQSGHLPQHYFYQDLYVANRIFINNPVKHVDVGSRIDGFVAHVASFREIDIFDIRPLKSSFKNMSYKQGDFMDENFGLRDYCDSVSSLHAIEHFGLGRYGDPIDCNGHLHGLDNIYRMLKKGGKFYFSVPIGREKIVFNAHRIFSVKSLVAIFKDKYKIDCFTYINDKEELIINAPLTPEDIENNYSFEYGCGIFELTKI